MDKMIILNIIDHIWVFLFVYKHNISTAIAAHAIETNIKYTGGL
jgi:sRNA-binding regulator protein Hfq